MDIGYLLARSAREFGDREAVRCGSEALTYGQMWDYACRLSGGLRRLGLSEGTRVGILTRNCIEHPVIDGALAAGGFIRVALNHRLTLQDLAFIVADSGMQALIAGSEFDEVASQLTESNAIEWIRLGSGEVTENSYSSLIATSDPYVTQMDLHEEAAWISYTSGSTGRPKGVILSHRALLKVAFNLMMEFGPQHGASSIMLPQSLSHGAGYFALTYHMTGGTVHLIERFEPELILELARRYQIHTLKLVPTMLADILDVSSSMPYREVIYGASPISETLLARALESEDVAYSQIYGQSEAPMTISCLSKADHVNPGDHLRSAGRPWRSVKVSVLNQAGDPVLPGEVGEVVVEAEHLMNGYLNMPEATGEVLRDGQLATRDMGMLDERGFLYLVGRRDEMIISGGYNVSPREVEKAVSGYAGVRECIAVGIPDAKWGEVVGIVVAPSAGVALDTDDLVASTKLSLGFRRPRRVRVVSELPKTGYGKVDRNAALRLFDE